MDTKSSDRRLSILHYIAQTVQDKFTDLVTFDSELQYLEKASVGWYSSSHLLPTVKLMLLEAYN